MEEILKKANELGLMIKGTEVYRRFAELSKKLDEDAEAKKLLEDYARYSEEMHQKEKSGSAIEVDEKQLFQELSEKIAQNQLIKEFIATQTYYLNMTLQIQKAINEPEGEPIEESKIITPGNTGKIITDL
jgi:cell fate (sporulation/competence/biofilm development) regulator YlbF (YheA/YmcA/DUF963 family)